MDDSSHRLIFYRDKKQPRSQALPFVEEEPGNEVGRLDKKLVDNWSHPFNSKN